jgi:hypothetical protein
VRLAIVEHIPLLASQLGATFFQVCEPHPSQGVQLVFLIQAAAVTAFLPAAARRQQQQRWLQLQLACHMGPHGWIIALCNVMLCAAFLTWSCFVLLLHALVGLLGSFHACKCHIIHCPLQEKLGPQCMKSLEDQVASIREAAAKTLQKIAKEFGAEWAKDHLVPQVRPFRVFVFLI